jgi:hypothetical protein
MGQNGALALRAWGSGPTEQIQWANRLLKFLFHGDEIKMKQALLAEDEEIILTVCFSLLGV